jgi:Ribose/xylose/arabinose/galactoside ABC-type transport systems, permease components
MKFLQGKKSVDAAIVPKRRGISSILVLFIALVVLFVVFSFTSKYFFTFRNIMNLLQQSAILGITACGATFIIISGYFDISVGAMTALVAVYSARFVEWSNLWYIGLIGGIVLGLVCGTTNALLITRLRINPLIATLGTMTIFRGIAYLENNGIPVPVYDDTFKNMGQGFFLKIPNVIWLLVVIFIIGGLILKYTSFGRRVYSIGGNAQASYFSGINVKRIAFYVFMLSGLNGGIAGVMYAALNGSGTPAGAGDLALDAISAVILGGAPLTGGRGSIVGTAIGVVLIGSISNALVLANVSSFYQMILKGVILIVAVGFDSLRSRGRAAYE